MTRQTIVHTLIWEFESEFQGVIKTLMEISEEEAKWKPTPCSKTLDTIRQWNEKGNEWISSQSLNPVSTIEFKVVHLAQCDRRVIH